MLFGKTFDAAAALLPFQKEVLPAEIYLRTYTSSPRAPLSPQPLPPSLPRNIQTPMSDSLLRGRSPPFSCLQRGWLNRRMFFGRWEYIGIDEPGGMEGRRGGGGEGGGGLDWRGILLYSDQSSRMISTFPSTTMPRELYAIRHAHTQNKSEDRRSGRCGCCVGKVNFSGMVSKRYSNVPLKSSG